MRTRRSFVPHLEQLETRVVLSRMALLPIEVPEETQESEETPEPTTDASPSRQTTNHQTDSPEPTEIQRPNEGRNYSLPPTRTEEPATPRIQNEPVDRTSTETEPTQSNDDQSSRPPNQATLTTDTNSSNTVEDDRTSDTNSSNPTTNDRTSDPTTEPSPRTTVISSREYQSEPDVQPTNSVAPPNSSPRTTVIGSRDLDSDPNDGTTDSTGSSNTGTRTTVSPSRMSDSDSENDPTDTPRTEQEPLNGSGAGTIIVRTGGNSQIASGERKIQETETDDGSVTSGNIRDRDETQDSQQRGLGVAEGTQIASDTQNRTETIAVLDYIFAIPQENGVVAQTTSHEKEFTVAKVTPPPADATQNVPSETIEHLKSRDAIQHSSPLVNPETLALGMLVLNAPHLFRRLALVSTGEEFFAR
ncbi:MAG: hypothetical protein KDA84_00580, partial [Planctomycetaceae bacterium]|nr:hypothetical protein [Planctomycetaceae bacterium]